MNVLTLTCSSSTGSATLVKNQKFYSTQWASEKSHAEIVTVKIQELLNQTHLEPTDLNLFGIDVGPGSFTGIRIGCNTVKSLCYLTQNPTYVFNSLELLAYGLPSSETKVCTTIDAYADSVYLAIFENNNGIWECTSSPLVVGIDKLDLYFKTPLLHVGDGLQKYEPKIKKIKKNIIEKPEYKNVPNSEVIANLVINNTQKKPLSSWKEISPFYIKMSSAEEKLLV